MDVDLGSIPHCYIQRTTFGEAAKNIYTQMSTMFWP